jgi:hypothetical protein
MNPARDVISSMEDFHILSALFKILNLDKEKLVIASLFSKDSISLWEDLDQWAELDEWLHTKKHVHQLSAISILIQM